MIALLGASALVLSACGGEGDVADPGQEEAETQMEETQTPTEDQTEAVDDLGSPTDGETDGLEDIQTGEQQEGASGEGPGLNAELEALNGSGADGTVSVASEGEGPITVTVTTTGVAAGAPHAQHLHIGGSNECPTEDAAGDDEFISTPEGQSAYGEIAVSLTTEGDTTPQSALAVDRFPVASDQGEVSYQRTFELPEGMTMEDLSNAVFVQHGLADSSLGEDPSAYDGPDSPLKSGVPQEATLPILCGPLGDGS